MAGLPFSTSASTQTDGDGDGGCYSDSPNETALGAVHPESAQKKLPARKTKKAVFITLEFLGSLLKWQKIVKVIVKM